MSTEQHSHAHGDHSHGDHSHGHSHGHSHDHWDGEEYLAKPGIREAAASSVDNVLFALQRSGLNKDDLSSLNLLEIGCGPGLVTAELAPLFATVHAIDTSDNMLKTFATQPAAQRENVTWAKHQLHSGSGDDFVRGNAVPSPTPEDPTRELKPPREKFDVAVANLVVHHVDNLDQFFKGLFSVLVPGGTVIITEFSTLPNGRDVLGEIREQEAQRAKELGSVNAPGVFHAPWSPELMGALLNKYGFEEVGGSRRGEIKFRAMTDAVIPTLYAYGTKPK